MEEEEEGCSFLVSDIPLFISILAAGGSSEGDYCDSLMIIKTENSFLNVL